MYPKRVYHCSCVAFEIRLCLIDGCYSLKDIVCTLNKNVNSSNKIYSTKCGNNEVIFSCRKHMLLVTQCENNKTRCLKCIRTYLKNAYNCYEYTNFNLPIMVKKERKVLCIIVEKL